MNRSHNAVLWRLASLGFIALIILGGVASVLEYNNTIYRLDRASALFNRGETGGFADELILYVERGRALLPTSGNPVWLFPTDATDFTEIQADLKGILMRARVLQRLPQDSDAYQQGMDDLRGKLRTIQAQVATAAPYTLVTPLNITFGVLWASVQLALVVALAKMKRREVSLDLRQEGELSSTGEATPAS